MSAPVGNGKDSEIERLNALVADLQAQRTHLYAEVARLREQRNAAIEMNAALQARIHELEGDQ